MPPKIITAGNKIGHGGTFISGSPTPDICGRAVASSADQHVEAESRSSFERPSRMTRLKSLATICTAAMLLFATNAVHSVRSELFPNEYCTVEQVDPYTMWRIDTLHPPSCKTVIKKSRTLGKDQRYAHIDGHVYWVQEHTEQRLIELMEIVGPVAFDRLQSYLSGTYASDGNVLLYGGRRVRTLNFSINPSGLRRFARHGIELSGYVTDGRLVLYEDCVLEGADFASFELIAPPTAKEKPGPEFARDISNVYYGADRIPDADPGSFQLADFSHAGEARIHGYYAVDRAHVWNLFEGIQLVRPEYAEEIRQRLRESPPVTTEPWKIPRQLKVLGCGLLLLITCILVLRFQARIRLRYQASLLSRAIGVLSVAYLVLPSIGYLLLFSRCSRPNDIVVWSLLGIGLVSGAILLSMANCNFMQRADAALTTAVQLGMVAAVLAVGTVPPLLLEAFKSIPAGISRQCPPEHHAVESRDRIKVARLRSEIAPAELAAVIAFFRTRYVTGYSTPDKT